MKHKISGFTLLEVLIALFIFTILSLILTSALHNVINIQSHTEKKAERLRQLQFTLLVMSRDIEAAINRPVLNAAGKEEPALIGEARTFALTHTGAGGTEGRSNLQRVKYIVSENELRRFTWPVLDAAPSTLPSSRILNQIEAAHFEYLDKQGKFHSAWPLEDKKTETLPRAIRINLTIPDWGRISQLYIINGDASNANNAPSKP